MHNKEYFRVDGDTDLDERMKYVKEFVREDNITAKVILISRVAGESIDLTGANHCVIWESDWNNSSTKQTIHRIYRFGQLKDIHVYKFFSEGIENLKYKKQLMKQCLSDRIIDKKDVKCYYKETSYRDYYASQNYEKMEFDYIIDDNQQNNASISNESLAFYLRLEKIYQPDNIIVNEENELFGQIEREVENKEIIKKIYEKGNLNKDRIPLLFDYISRNKQFIANKKKINLF